MTRKAWNVKTWYTLTSRHPPANTLPIDTRERVWKQRVDKEAWHTVGVPVNVNSVCCGWVLVLCWAVNSFSTKSRKKHLSINLALGIIVVTGKCFPQSVPHTLQTTPHCFKYTTTWIQLEEPLGPVFSFRQTDWGLNPHRSAAMIWQKYVFSLLHPTDTAAVMATRCSETGSNGPAESQQRASSSSSSSSSLSVLRCLPATTASLSRSCDLFMAAVGGKTDQ